MRLYRDHELIAVHPRFARPTAAPPPITTCHRREALASKLRNPLWCLIQSRQTGDAGARLIRRLFAVRVLENLCSPQCIVGLKKRYGAARLEAACQRALDYDSPRDRAVKAILNKGLDQHPAAEQAFDALAESHTGASRICRNTSHLLTH